MRGELFGEPQTRNGLGAQERVKSREPQGCLRVSQLEWKPCGGRSLHRRGPSDGQRPSSSSRRYPHCARAGTTRYPAVPIG